MRDHISHWPFCHSAHAPNVSAIVLAVLIALVVPRGHLRAETTEATPALNSAEQVCDPFEHVETDCNSCDTILSDSPIDADSYVPTRPRWETKQANFQGPIVQAPQQTTTGIPPASAATLEDPCAAARFRPLNELNISISQPDGQTPTDFATPCWEQINAGQNGAPRCWSVLNYQWDATCLCYQPLYFEDINAERYGYICNDCCGCYCTPQDCMQSACSAAHFFATVPALPYLVMADCPTECVYTLGHYRPASCGVPWRCHWPPIDPVAAVKAGGIYTGLIFAIP
jgi:hypothetical protein